MGFNGCWLAMRDIGFEALEREYKISVLSLSECKDPFNERHQIGVLENGWTICIVKDKECRLLDQKSLSALSVSANVICCLVSEGAECSIVQFWRGGSLSWEVSYPLSEDQDSDVEYVGIDFPPSFWELREAALAATQNDPESLELFELPLSLAREVTGFHHDCNKLQWKHLHGVRLADWRAG